MPKVALMRREPGTTGLPACRDEPRCFVGKADYKFIHGPAVTAGSLRAVTGLACGVADWK